MKQKLFCLVLVEADDEGDGSQKTPCFCFNIEGMPILNSSLEYVSAEKQRLETIFPLSKYEVHSITLKG